MKNAARTCPFPEVCHYVDHYEREAAIPTNGVVNPCFNVVKCLDILLDTLSGSVCDVIYNISV